ncbi:hypothetical protein ACFVJ5_07395 [Nocardia sp. NPDC127606]|uniref:hypothetical protein n=1 Tax=Nocardia sp. NPDC127606 TaxID=3345406 RepID=UPI00363A7524
MNGFDTGRTDEREIDLQVWQEVARIRNEWAVDVTLTSAERHLAVEEEAAELTARINGVESQLLEQALTAWIDAHRGEIPTAAIVAALAASTRGESQRQVLCEHLYIHVLPSTIARHHAVAGRTAARHRRVKALTGADPERWRERAVTPSPSAAAIVRRSWGVVHSGDFVILALALVQVRLDGGMPIPVTPLDPLADELAATLHAQLIAEGLPPI